MRASECAVCTALHKGGIGARYAARNGGMRRAVGRLRRRVNEGELAELLEQRLQIVVRRLPLGGAATTFDRIVCGPERLDSRTVLESDVGLSSEKVEPRG